MTTIIAVNQDQMRLMSTLDKGVKFMRSKGDPKFNVAIEKHKSLKKEVLEEISLTKTTLG